MKSFQEFLILSEGGLSRALGKSETHDTGHISPDRGDDESENRKKRKQLESDLRKKGIGFKKSTGKYKYEDGSQGREVSYHTTRPEGMSKRKFGKTMRKLGNKYGQESVITKKSGKGAKLHYTDDSGQKSENIGKAKAGKHPMGYGETGEKRQRGSKLKDKEKDREFHYESAIAIKAGSKFLPKIPSALKAIGAGAVTGATILQAKKKDDDGDVNITPRNLKNLENAVFRGKIGRKLDGEILKRREQKKQMKKGPFADTGGFDASKSRTKRQYLGLPPSSNLSKQQKKDRKITGQAEILRKRDDDLATKGPGDLVPNAKKERLKQLLKKYMEKSGIKAKRDANKKIDKDLGK